MTYQPERSLFVGDYFIAPGIGENCVWIGRAQDGKDDGEGADFPIDAVEALIADFYEKHF